MGTIASQITSLAIVYSIVYSDADQRKHQSSASLAFVREFTGDRWIPRTNGQLRGKCFHLMTSSCFNSSHFSIGRQSRNVRRDLARSIIMEGLLNIVLASVCAHLFSDTTEPSKVMSASCHGVSKSTIVQSLKSETCPLSTSRIWFEIAKTTQRVVFYGMGFSNAIKNYPTSTVSTKNKLSYCFCYLSK